MIIGSKFPSKFRSHWMGPYKVQIAPNNDSFDLVDFESTPLSTRINGYHLKAYHR